MSWLHRDRLLTTIEGILYIDCYCYCRKCQMIKFCFYQLLVRRDRQIDPVVTVINDLPIINVSNCTHLPIGTLFLMSFTLVSNILVSSFFSIQDMQMSVLKVNLSAQLDHNQLFITISCESFLFQHILLYMSSDMTFTC